MGSRTRQRRTVLETEDRTRQRRTVLETEHCKYLFNPDGSCVVQYEGPLRPGKVTGSCLPVRLGGDCHGLPRECVNCHQL